MSTQNYVNEHILVKESELRIEVDWDQQITLKILDGFAECFGIELAASVPYQFYGGSHLAVFTYQGCIVEIEGLCKVAYVAKETPMNYILNIHLALENLRQAAKKSRTTGPTIAVIGPADSGKTTLCRILTSYAVRASWQPLFVDLDPQNGTLVMPTSVGAVVVDRIDVEQSSGFDLNTAPPLIYSFGHFEPSTNPKVYNAIVTKLAKVVGIKRQKESIVDQSGCIIDTPDWSERSMDQLLSQIAAFKIDSIVVTGAEKLYNEVKQVLLQQFPHVQLVYIQKSGGCVTRDRAYRKRLHAQKVREYFYGTPKYELSPFTSSVSWGEVAVRRICEVVTSIPSVAPLDSATEIDESKLIKIEIGPVLLHTVLAVSNSDLQYNANDADEQSLVETNIAGFVYISAADEKKKRLSLLSSTPGKLPKRYLWLGSLRWTET